MRTIEFHEKAKEEFTRLNERDKELLAGLFERLKKDSHLPRNKFKNLSGSCLYEFRARRYRALGAWRKGYFVVLVLFQKDSQKTPLSKIRLAYSRLEELN
jgi:phage-related protein